MKTIIPADPLFAGVREGLVHIPDVRAALDRAQRAYNFAQLEDALRSANMFMTMVTDAVQAAKTKR